MKTLPATIHEMLNSPEWDAFISDRLGNDLFLSDPDRAERIHSAAENGADGSTHQEVIDDWRDFVNMLHREASQEAWGIDDEKESEAAEKAADAWHEAIMAEIDKCEAWHEANGSLYEEIG